jgi:hypothetical protein
MRLRDCPWQRTRRSSIVPGMADDGLVMEGALHRYRICELENRELEKTEKRRGRPKRLTVIAWNDLSDVEVDVLRRLNEPRLAPNQVAELDGRIVARGAEVTQNDIDDSETTQAPAPLKSDSPTEVTEFAHRMCWDIYVRDVEASLELRKQAHALNERAMEQGKQIDAMIGHLVAIRADMLRQQPAAAPQQQSITIADIKDLVQTSLVLVHEMSKGGGGTGQQST